MDITFRNGKWIDLRTNKEIKVVKPKTKYLYHGTPLGHVKDICIEGIVSKGKGPTWAQSRMGLVYLSKDVFDAAKWSRLNPDAVPVVFRIPIKKLTELKCDILEDPEGYGFATHCTLNPNNLEYAKVTFLTTGEFEEPIGLEKLKPNDWKKC